VEIDDRRDKDAAAAAETVVGFAELGKAHDPFEEWLSCSSSTHRGVLTKSLQTCWMGRISNATAFCAEVAPLAAEGPARDAQLREKRYVSGSVLVAYLFPIS